MRSIEIKLSWHSYPLSVLDETVPDGIPYMSLPEGYENDLELAHLVDKVQDVYDDLFINTKHEFSYKGFQSKAEKREFVKLLEELLDMLERKVGHEYYIDRNALEEFK